MCRKQFSFSPCYVTNCVAVQFVSSLKFLLFACAVCLNKSCFFSFFHYTEHAPGTEDEGDLHQPPMMSSEKEMGESR